jgi:hypothetical protein
LLLTVLAIQWGSRKKGKSETKIFDNEVACAGRYAGGPTYTLEFGPFHWPKNFQV